MFVFFFKPNTKRQIMTSQKRCNKPTLIIDGSSLSKFQRTVLMSKAQVIKRFTKKC